MLSQFYLDENHRKQLDEIALLIVYTTIIAKASSFPEVLSVNNLWKDYQKVCSFFSRLLQEQFDLFHTEMLKMHDK